MVKGTMFLQIKTGTLFPFAAALKNQKWQALPKDDIQNRVEMNHFHRKMEMVDLTLDVEYVLTGNSFEVDTTRILFSNFLGVRMYMNKENIISVKIFGTAYRFATGKLANKTIEGQPRKRNAPKETVDVINKIPLIDVNTTILTNFNSIPKNYNTVRFGISKDGNEFLPYFDGQDVDLKDASALSGLELFYYYTEGYGGFIKPRISTVSYYDGLEGIYQSTDYVEFINVSLD